MLNFTTKKEVYNKPPSKESDKKTTPPIQGTITPF
jgi:hypothetical protein